MNVRSLVRDYSFDIRKAFCSLSLRINGSAELARLTIQRVGETTHFNFQPLRKRVTTSRLIPTFLRRRRWHGRTRDGSGRHLAGFGLRGLGSWGLRASPRARSQIPNLPTNPELAKCQTNLCADYCKSLPTQLFSSYCLFSCSVVISQKPQQFGPVLRV